MLSRPDSRWSAIAGSTITPYAGGTQNLKILANPFIEMDRRGVARNISDYPVKHVLTKTVQA